jgi:hypothetical protein
VGVGLLAVVTLVATFALPRWPQTPAGPVV